MPPERRGQHGGASVPSPQRVARHPARRMRSSIGPPRARKYRAPAGTHCVPAATGRASRQSTILRFGRREERVAVQVLAQDRSRAAGGWRPAYSGRERRIHPGHARPADGPRRHEHQRARARDRVGDRLLSAGAARRCGARQQAPRGHRLRPERGRSRPTPRGARSPGGGRRPFAQLRVDRDRQHRRHHRRRVDRERRGDQHPLPRLLPERARGVELHQRPELLSDHEPAGALLFCADTDTRWTRRRRRAHEGQPERDLGSGRGGHRIGRRGLARIPRRRLWHPHRGVRDQRSSRSSGVAHLQADRPDQRRRREEARRGQALRAEDARAARARPAAAAQGRARPPGRHRDPRLQRRLGRAARGGRPPSHQALDVHGRRATWDVHERRGRVDGRPRGGNHRRHPARGPGERPADAIHRRAASRARGSSAARVVRRPRP